MNRLFPRMGARLAPSPKQLAHFGGVQTGRGRSRAETILSIPCDTPGSWPAGWGSVAANTSEWVCASASFQAVKLTLDGVSGHGSGTATFDIGAPTDLRDRSANAPFVLLRVYIHEGSGPSSWEKLLSLKLLVGESGFGAYFTATLAGNGTEGSVLWPGWHTIVVPPSSFTVAAGAPAWSALQMVRVSLERTDTVDFVPAITIDQVAFLEPAPRGLYAFTTDDGASDLYDVAGYLTSKGLVGTFYVITNRIDTPGYLTTSQLRQMQNAGHLIANHTSKHGNWVDDTMSDAQIINEVTKGAEWLSYNGFGRGARVAAVPGGTSQISEDRIHLLLGSHVDQLRVTSGKKPSSPYWWDDQVQFVSAIDSPTNATTALDAVVDDGGGCAISLFHRKETGYTWVQLKAHIDAVAVDRDAGDIDVVTMDDLLNVQAA